MNRPNRPTPNRTTQFSIRNLLIATAIVAIILPWQSPSILWLKLQNDRPNVTVPDGVTMLIGGENWRRVRRRIYSTDTPKQTPAHPIAINVTATNSVSPRPRDTNAIVVTSTTRTIIEERNDDLAIRPIDRDKFGPHKHQPAVERSRIANSKRIISNATHGQRSPFPTQKPGHGFSK